MTIDDLVDGISYALQGPLCVRVIRDSPEAEEVFEGDASGWRSIPEKVRAMEIGYMFPSVLDAPRGRIVIEVIEEEG